LGIDKESDFQKDKKKKNRGWHSTRRGGEGGIEVILKQILYAEYEGGEKSFFKKPGDVNHFPWLG
jgi:hypothetical protein